MYRPTADHLSRKSLLISGLIESQLPGLNLTDCESNQRPDSTKSQGKPFRRPRRSRILIRRENVTKHGRDIVGLVETEVSPNDCKVKFQQPRGRHQHRKSGGPGSGQFTAGSQISKLRQRSKENKETTTLKFLNTINSKIAEFFHNAKDEAGQTLVEYGLIVALISIVAIAALTLVGSNVTDVFNSVAGELGGAS